MIADKEVTRRAVERSNCFVMISRTSFSNCVKGWQPAITNLHRATVAYRDNRERFRPLFEQTTTTAAGR